MRKLASIQRIVSLSPIAGADRILKAQVLGWECVVKRDEFKEGELVVYIETDSILPFNPWSDFLKDKDKPDKPIRLKTIRMKKQISQGLLISTKWLPEGTPIEEGADVTELLGITKYEPPEETVAPNAKGKFPSFLIKTDETRIQAVPNVLVRHKGKRFVVTEKLDGSSHSYYYLNDNREAPEFGACSRNLDLKVEPNAPVWQLADRFAITQALGQYADKVGGSIALQGEIVGPKFNGNKLLLTEPCFYAYNLFDIKNRKYFPHDTLIAFCNDTGIPHVPVLEHGFELNFTVPQLLEMATRRSTITSGVWAEGLVFRPLEEDTDEELAQYGSPRLSFKVINPEWLLTYKQ